MAPCACFLAGRPSAFAAQSTCCDAGGREEGDEEREGEGDGGRDLHCCG